jgi:MFS family permease
MTRSPSLSRAASFWVITFAFLSLTALSTAPSPLYGLYAQHDGFSSFTTTIVYAIYVVGVVTSLIVAGHISDWYGRRVVLSSSLTLAIAAAVVFVTAESLAGLIVARLLIGLALGAGIATATAYLSDLDSDAAGKPTRRSGIVSTLANVGGLATGPLVAGLLASYGPHPLRLPYVVLGAALIVGLVATLVAVEGHTPAQPPPAYHPQRFKSPAEGRTVFFAALTAAFTSFAVFGLIAGLTGTLLVESFHHTSPALTGLVIFLNFGTGAVAQTTTTSWPSHRLFAAGTIAAICGVAIIVISVWLHPASLPAFLIGCVVSGAGCGALFRGGIQTVISTSTADDRAGALATFFTAGYAGISIPVIGAGIVIQFASSRVTLLLFGIGVVVGLLCAAPVLVRARDQNQESAGTVVRLNDVTRPRHRSIGRGATEGSMPERRVSATNGRPGRDPHRDRQHRR